MKIEDLKKIYFMGIKGVGMCSLAVYCKKRGIKVLGSDVEKKFVTDKALKRNKIEVRKGFRKENIEKDLDLMVVTGAHGGRKNIEAREARKLAIPILTQAEALGFFSKGKRLIAVCGVGGKSTVSAMLATVFKTANLKPSYVVGVGEIFPIGAGGDYGEGEFFIAEADEYCACLQTLRMPRFSFLKPEIVVLTNLEYDHPDFYKNFSETKAAFYSFISKIKRGGCLVINFDNLNNREFLKKIKKELGWKIEIITYGFNKGADFKIVKKKNGFRVVKRGEKAKEYRIWVKGRMNMANAAAAAIVGKIAKIKDEKVRKGLASFKGTKRRFEKIGERKGILIYDDYAHHPEEIKSLLNMVRNLFRDKRIIVVFQPHTFSRTKKLMTGFAKSFENADILYLSDIFASAREKNKKLVSIEDLKKKIEKKGRKVNCFKNKERLLGHLKGELKKGDLVVTVGAGDIYEVGEKILKGIN